MHFPLPWILLVPLCILYILATITFVALMQRPLQAGTRLLLRLLLAFTVKMVGLVAILGSVALTLVLVCKSVGLQLFRLTAGVAAEAVPPLRRAYPEWVHPPHISWENVLLPLLALGILRLSLVIADKFMKRLEKTEPDQSDASFVSFPDSFS